MASNFGNLNRDLFGSNLNIKGNKVIDEQRNIKAKNGTFSNLLVRKDLTVHGNIITNNVKLVIFLVPTQDGTELGVPYIPIYEDAAKIWPVLDYVIRVTPKPIFAGGSLTSAQVADWVDNEINTLKAEGYNHFILPNSSSIGTALAKGSTPTMNNVPIQVRHPDIIMSSRGNAGQSISGPIYGVNGNYFTFSDYLTEQDNPGYTVQCLSASLSPSDLIYICFANAGNDVPIGNQRQLNVDAWNFKDAVESAGFTTKMIKVNHVAPGGTSDNFDWSNVDVYTGALDVNSDLPPPVSTGNDILTLYALDIPKVLVGGFHFSGGSNPNNFSGTAITHGVFAVTPTPEYWFWEFDMQPFTFPKDVKYGCGTSFGYDLIPTNCEMTKMGWPSDLCSWNNPGVGSRGRVNYNVVMEFAWHATEGEYCGPNGMLKFRSNGIGISPYVGGGLGTYLPANEVAVQDDKLIVSPIWYSESLDLSIVNPTGPYFQTFGLC